MKTPDKYKGLLSQILLNTGKAAVLQKMEDDCQKENMRNQILIKEIQLFEKELQDVGLKGGVSDDALTDQIGKFKKIYKRFKFQIMRMETGGAEF